MRGSLSWPPRAIAHRGLHDAARGILENTASAFSAAIAAGCAIEADVIEAACGGPVVFHDEELSRLTTASGPLRLRTAAELRRIPMVAGAGRILTLGETLELVAGAVPLFIEIKSRWDGGRTGFAARIAAALASYRGEAHLMSFDPLTIAPFRALAPDRRRGLVAMRFRSREWPSLGQARLARLNAIDGAALSQASFIAFDVNALPRPAVTRARQRHGLAVFGWTARSPGDWRRAARHCDGVIFEGFPPPPRGGGD